MSTGRKYNTGQRGGSLHREGVYHLRIIKAEDSNAKSSGNDMVSMQLAVLKNGKSFGPMIFDHVVMTEEAEWRWQSLMDAVDAPENIDIDAAWLEGREVYARLEIDNYDPENPRNKIKRYLLPTVGQKQMAEEQNEGPDLLASDNGSKAKNRAGARKNQPAELDEAEKMPL